MRQGHNCTPFYKMDWPPSIQPRRSVGEKLGLGARLAVSGLGVTAMGVLGWRMAIILGDARECLSV